MDCLCLQYCTIQHASGMREHTLTKPISNGLLFAFFFQTSRWSFDSNAGDEKPHCSRCFYRLSHTFGWLQLFNCCQVTRRAPGMWQKLCGQKKTKREHFRRLKIGHNFQCLEKPSVSSMRSPKTQWRPLPISSKWQLPDLCFTKILNRYPMSSKSDSLCAILPDVNVWAGQKAYWQCQAIPRLYYYLQLVHNYSWLKFSDLGPRWVGDQQASLQYEGIAEGIYPCPQG